MNIDFKTLEIIQINPFSNGKRTAILSFKRAETINEDLTNGYDFVEVPINIRPIKLSSRGNMFVDQSFDGEVIQDLSIGGTIDLNQCIPGDILISKHGIPLEYVCKTPWNEFDYLDHVVKYLVNPDDSLTAVEGCYGTRTNDGHTFMFNRDPKDHDIVKVIRGREFITESKQDNNAEI